MAVGEVCEQLGLPMLDCLDHPLKGWQKGDRRFDVLVQPPPVRLEAAPFWVNAPGPESLKWIDAGYGPNPQADVAVAAGTYVIARTLLFLVDGHAHPDAVAMAMAASRMNVPLWIVSDRAAVSAWLLAYADLVVKEAAVPGLVYDFLEHQLG